MRRSDNRRIFHIARKDKPMTLDEIKAAVEDLVRMGLVADSGKRKWAEQTQRYEVLLDIDGRWPEVELE
jgi:hypothetical protein